MMPRGELSASFDWPEIVELSATSASLLMMPFHIALLDENCTRVTSLSVRPAKAISASTPWVSAGEPTTTPTRLPLMSFTSFTPVSLATARPSPLQAVAAIIRRAGWGPQVLVPNSKTPSWAKYTPMPICEMTARLAFTGDSRPVSLPDGRMRTSEP
jgi:hypothetical protein